MSFPLACLARCTAAILLATSAIAYAQAPQARPPIASFFNNPQLARPVLSPNGKLLGIVAREPGKRDALVVMDLASSKVHIAARFLDVDIGAFWWVNDKRLVFGTGDTQLAPRDQRYGPGLYAANFDGGEPRQLVARRGRSLPPGSVNVLSSDTWLIPQAAPQSSDSVYVTRLKNDGHYDNFTLLSLNTLTGDLTRAESPDGARAWLFDDQGVLRAAAVGESGKAVFQFRASSVEPWRELSTVKTLAMDGAKLLGFGPAGTLYMSTANGKDKEAVYALDTGSGKLVEPPLVVTNDYDFDGSLITRKDKLLGLRLRTDAASTFWIDPAMKALQEEIDGRLESTLNLISVPTRPEAAWVLVESYSDVRPVSYRVYHTATKTFTAIGESRPAIRPEQMGRQEMVRYKARDGREIPALLTLPPEGKRGQMPMVVLVHGGPWVRGSTWGWHPESQFLASRGYAVLEPYFRGTTGFGKAHFVASFKQWGLAMQDDVADGAKWAIAEGIVDPKRICIAGASYGGYATLMGLVNDPDLFRCGINWVGVTDINLLYQGHWRYLSDDVERLLKFTMPERMGDPVKDAAQLKATSPIMQAARIHQPLLMAYGAVDGRVKLVHGLKFHEAVTKTNKDVEWVVYPDEGHGWALQETRVDFWTRVEKFLERNIGK